MDHFEASINALQEKLRDQEAEVMETKKLINRLAEAAGRQPIYNVEEVSAATSIGAIRDDTFYGQPLSTSVRRYLEMRKASNLGPASVREIYDALLQGGYVFGAKSEKNAIDGLRISLGKTRAVHRLPTSGKYGLRAWYPNLRGAEANGAGEGKNGKAEESNEQSDAEQDDESSHKEVHHAQESREADQAA